MPNRVGHGQIGHDPARKRLQPRGWAANPISLRHQPAFYRRLDTQATKGPRRSCANSASTV